MMVIKTARIMWASFLFAYFQYLLSNAFNWVRPINFHNERAKGERHAILIILINHQQQTVLNVAVNKIMRHQMISP